MRGIFTAGVLDVLMEHDIWFENVIGVSAGAAFGCNYKSHQTGRVVRYNLKYCQDPRYCSVRSLLTTGDIFGASFCYDDIPNRLDIFDYDTFNRSAMQFYVVCTDMKTGQPVYHLCDHVDEETFEWIRASASMPLVSHPVTAGGHTMLDGGIADSIPLRFFLDQGFGRNVVVLTQPREYKKKKNKLMPLYRIGLRKYPQLVRAIEHRPQNYNESRALVFDQERNGHLFVICPDEPLPIHRVEHDPERIREVYDIGRRVMHSRLDALADFLSAKR